MWLKVDAPSAATAVHSFLTDREEKASTPPAAPSRHDAGSSSGPAAEQAHEQGTWIYSHCPFGLQRSHPGHKSHPRCGPEPAAVPFLRLLCCVSGKGMKTPTSSTQQPAAGTTTPTKATGGNQWPSRMTEVRANPLSLGMKATCWRRDDAFSRVGSSPRAGTSPGLFPAHTPRLSVLVFPQSTVPRLHLDNACRN